MNGKRRLGRGLALFLGLGLLACKPSAHGPDAGTDAAPEAAATSVEAVPDAAPEAASSAVATHAGPRFGPPAAGTPCNSATETLGCAPDHGTELTCSGGTWRAMQACRGPGACKGTGASVSCDVGPLITGDPCVPGNPPPRCLNPRSVVLCSGGKWTESVCLPPSTCKPGTAGAPAGCR